VYVIFWSNWFCEWWEKNCPWYLGERERELEKERENPQVLCKTGEPLL